MSRGWLGPRHGWALVSISGIAIGVSPVSPAGAPCRHPFPLTLWAILGIDSIVQEMPFGLVSTWALPLSTCAECLQCCLWKPMEAHMFYVSMGCLHYILWHLHTYHFPPPATLLVSRFPDMHHHHVHVYSLMLICTLCTHSPCLVYKNHCFFSGVSLLV